MILGAPWEGPLGTNLGPKAGPKLEDLRETEAQILENTHMISVNIKPPSWGDVIKDTRP